MSECDPCKPVDCANEDDFNLYNLQSGQVRAPAVPSGTEPCKTCLPIACSDGSRLDDDFNLYRLQSELYPLVIPFGLNIPGAEIRMECCDGFDVIRIVPQGLSPGGFAFLIGQMLDECALREPFCAPTVDAPATTPMFQLSVDCCDGTRVVRQIPTFTPMSQVQFILNQMAVECALHPGCQNTLLLIDLIDGMLVVIISDIENVLTIKRTLVELLISGTNQQLLDEAAAEDLLVTVILDHVNELIETITNIENNGGLTPPQLVIANIITTIAEELAVLAGFMTAISNLVQLIALGGNVAAAEVLLAAQQAAMTASANAKLDAVADLPTIGNTPIIVLLGALLTKLAADTNGLSQLAALQVSARRLSTAFTSGDGTELISAANNATISSAALDAAALVMVSAANAAQTALDAAVSDGSITAALAARFQQDIDVELAIAASMQCQADAGVGLAAVAVAESLGSGMVGALAALEPIAACLEASEAGLTATGDAQAIALVGPLHDLVLSLRALALGLATAAATSDALNLKARVEMIVLLVIQLDIEVITLEVTRLIVEEVFGTLTMSFICFPARNIVSRTFQSNFTAQQRAVLYAEMIAECEEFAITNRLFPDEFNGDTITQRQLFASDPQSCTSFCGDGTAFNWTTVQGLYIGLTQAAANNAARRAACEQASAYRICLSNLPSLYCVGVAFSANITTGGLSSGPGNLWSLLSGVLPTGLSFVPHGTYATISGTPTGTGLFGFTIQMVATNGAINAKAYTMEGLQVLPLTLPTFQVGTPYSEQLTLSGSFGGTITFAVTSGDLPDGITLTEAGLLSGIPTSASAFSFTIAGTEA